jgi:GTPase SAR1 family protein
MGVKYLMERTKQKYYYQSCGLNFISEIHLPELIQNQYLLEEDSICIKVGDLSSLWLKCSNLNSLIVVQKDFMLFQVPELATFCIRDGNTIIVSPIMGADEGKIRLYLLGTCMGALLIQRKILPLHGSAIAINGKAYAIVGHSGAGKSTLASAFLKQGFQLLSDDIIPVAFKDNIPMVFPSYPQQKLWQQSLIEFGMNYKNYKPLFERETKYAVPVAKFNLESIPLAGVIELIKTEQKEIQFPEIKGVKRLRTLFQHTYRRSYLPKLDLIDWHFKECVKLINEIQVSQLYRPNTHFTANQLVKIILESINQKEKITC